MPRQKLKPWPKVFSSGSRSGARRPKPPKPNCAAAAPAISTTNATVRRARFTRMPSSVRRDRAVDPAFLWRAALRPALLLRRLGERSVVLGHFLAEAVGYFVRP